MTLIIGWIACDQDGPCSAYMASDSRFSSGVQRYDFGKKLFAFNNSPDIIGFCGDVMFSQIILPTLVHMCDEGGLIDKKMSSDDRSKILYTQIKTQYSKYKLSMGPIYIYHISRDKDRSFKVFKYSCKSNCLWEKEILTNTSEKSFLAFYDGSGGREFWDQLSYYQVGNNTDTSRNYFHCFCDVLSNIKDKACGGSPQLVGLYDGEKFNGMNFGIISGSSKYYMGTTVDDLKGFDDVRWYNENFEICNSKTLLRKAGAMVQPISRRATP